MKGAAAGVFATCLLAAPSAIAQTSDPDQREFVSDLAIVSVGAGICRRYELNPASGMIYSMTYNVEAGDVGKGGRLYPVFAEAFGGAKVAFANQSSEMVCAALELMYGPLGVARRALVMTSD